MELTTPQTQAVPPSYSLAVATVRIILSWSMLQELVEKSSTSTGEISSVCPSMVLKDQLPVNNRTGNTRLDLIVNGTASVSSSVEHSTIRRNMVVPLDTPHICGSLGGRERHTSRRLETKTCGSQWLLYP